MSDSYKAWCESQGYGRVPKPRPETLIDFLQRDIISLREDVELLKCLLPPVETLSGWDDPGCPPDIARRLQRVARIQDVPVPPHLIEAAAREDDCE